MATHPSNLAWEIPWTKERGGLQSMGTQRVEHDLVTKQQKIVLLAAKLGQTNKKLMKQTTCGVFVLDQRSSSEPLEWEH